MWQPIETAPQSDPILGAWHDEDGWHFAEITYDKGKWVTEPTETAVQHTNPAFGEWHEQDGRYSAEMSYEKGETTYDTHEDCKPTLWAPLPVGL